MGGQLALGVGDQDGGHGVAGDVDDGAEHVEDAVHGEDDGDSGGLTGFMIRNPAGENFESIVSVSDFFQLRPGTRLHLKVMDRPGERVLDLYLVRFVQNEGMFRGKDCATSWVRKDGRACNRFAITGYWETSYRDPLEDKH